MLHADNRSKGVGHTRRKERLDASVTLLLSFLAVLEHFVKKLAHVEVVNVHVYEFNDRQHTFVQVAQNVHQALQVVFSACSLKVNH